MENNRLIWADSLKGWLMILVILGHAIQAVLKEECYQSHLWNLIYSFHMPSFMAISGWLAFKIVNHKKTTHCVYGRSGGGIF